MSLKRRFFLFLAAVLLCSLSACSWFGSDSGAATGVYAESSDSGPGGNEVSLLNYRIARDYAADGRYELAREHYLLALAAAGTPELRNSLARELSGVDKMIKSLR